MEHLRLTLKLLRKHKLYGISDKGISRDPENIEAMMSWDAPRKLTDVISFVGLVGYCKKFTKEDSTGKVESMYRLRKPTCELVVP